MMKDQIEERQEESLRYCCTTDRVAHDILPLKHWGYKSAENSSHCRELALPDSYR